MRILWTAKYFLLPVIPIALTLQTLRFYLRNGYLMLSMIVGVYAYVRLVIQFILSARLKFIERHFGMDRLYRFYNQMAVVSFFLVLAYNQIKGRVFGLEKPLPKIALILFGSAFFRRFIPVEAATYPRFEEIFCC